MAARKKKVGQRITPRSLAQSGINVQKGVDGVGLIDSGI